MNRTQVLTFFAKRLKPILSMIERDDINRYGKMPMAAPLIFIIGAPRTGSTILYQILTNQFNVSYIDNLACCFRENLFTGMKLSHLFFKNNPHNSFSSVHGNTSGFHAPSECGRFWSRYFSQNKLHQISMEDSLRRELVAIVNYYQKPLIIKNLFNSVRLDSLTRLFPEAYYIFIKRDPIFVAQSILLAKRRLNLADNDIWSVVPQNGDLLKGLNGYEQIVKQIFFIEKQIHDALQKMPSNKYLTIHYEQLISNLREEINQLGEHYGLEKRKDFENAKLIKADTKKISKEEADRFNQEINRLDWENYVFE
jgi:LPS sulfotransferase NodH